MFEFASDYPLIYRILIIAAVAGGSHLLVMLIKNSLTVHPDRQDRDDFFPIGFSLFEEISASGYDHHDS
ncbi:MAG: hypothetical protein JJU46_03815 [Balneolaceae bacterium]|nr:hypothetical protein [Balneolaceae bacterium]